MRKSLLTIVSIFLLLFELYLCTLFLPASWQEVIDRRIAAFWPQSPDWTATTHPQLQQEIDHVLQQHTVIRIVLSALPLILLLGNTWLIYKLWRYLSRPPKSI